MGIMTEMEKTAVDVISVGGLGLVFMDLIPGFTALVMLLWAMVRLYETDTVTRLIKWVRSK
jgi:hypothetical protein